MYKASAESSPASGKPLLIESLSQNGAQRLLVSEKSRT